MCPWCHHAQQTEKEAEEEKKKQLQQIKQSDEELRQLTEKINANLQATNSVTGKTI